MGVFGNVSEDDMDRCEFCSCVLLANGDCRSCNLYNAAVVAQQAAALHIAKTVEPRASRAWLNEYGVFAWVRGKAVRVGTSEQAAPFVALTSAARRVTFSSEPMLEKTG
jgi:hypothetical protein